MNIFKKINFYLFISITAVLFFFISACKKNEPATPNYLLSINLESTVNDTQKLEIFSKTYNTLQGYPYYITQFKFYISNVYLSNSTEKALIAPVFLYNSDSAKNTLNVANIPVGCYTTLQIGLGIDSATNATNPNTYEPTHPLSAQQNTYWQWSKNYRNLMIEGRTNKDNCTDFCNGILYHTGHNSLYQTLTLTLPTQVCITNENKQNIDLEIDINKILGNINVQTQNETQVLNDLAIQLTQNFAGAWRGK